MKNHLTIITTVLLSRLSGFIFIYYRYRRESQTNQEVGGPVDGYGDRAGDGPAGLREQLGDEEPGDGAGPRGETNHEQDDGNDGQVANPRQSVL